jgi:GNAT superfamily N-acetyltransferase
MDVQLREARWSALPDLARVPISFTVERVLDVRPSDGDFVLVERALPVPYVKDYDALGGEGPRCWAERFDLARWGLILAWAGPECIGGVTLAFDTPEVDLLEGRKDLAVVWDLRVAPAWRRRRVGAALFGAAETWARARGCRQLKVETQNVNVPACRFYARRGCVLGAIDRFAYPQCPDEIQLLWYKDLATERHGVLENG